MIKVEKLEDKVKFAAFGKSSKHVAKRNAHKNDNKSGCDSIDECGGIECDTCKDVDAVVSFESFRALKLTLFESFKVLKSYDPIRGC